MADSTMETWENLTQGRVMVRRNDPRRGLLGSELISGGRTFHITPDDRRINQEMAANPRQDLFANGSLRPVRLLDSSEDALEIAANPNLISETDMKGLFGLHHRSFPGRIDAISNPNALTRILELALDEGTKATHKQVEIVKARLREVAPGLFEEVRPMPALNRDGTPVARDFSREPAPRAVTPL